MTHDCHMNDGSAKMVKVYMDQGTEKVVTVPSPRTSLLILDAKTGEQLAFSGDGWEGTVLLKNKILD